METEETYKEQLEAILGDFSRESVFNPEELNDPMTKRLLTKDLDEIENGNRTDLLSNLNNYLSPLGLDSCEDEDIVIRDELIEKFKQKVEPCKPIIVAEMRTLETFFKQMYERWEESSDNHKGSFDLFGHYVLNGQANLIQTRVRLGKIGVLEPFNEKEYESALYWLKETIKLISKNSINEIIDEYESEYKNILSNDISYDLFDNNINALPLFLKRLCKPAKIGIDDLGVDKDYTRKVILDALNKGTQEPSYIKKVMNELDDFLDS